MRSIRENDCDILGLQECSSDIQSYLSAQLTDTYNISYFSPYAQNGNGDKAQGLAYKKDWTLSDWHYFWLSDTPGTMCQNDSDANGNYKRGGCCGTLTKGGKSIFVMVTHGALNAEVREQYAHVYKDMEQLYNPSGYPSFFVGDMNAQPDRPESAEYRTYWTDAYDGAGSAGRIGPYSTFNAFNLSRNMYSDPHRIDYIYYRGAITPLNYVCNGTKYDGYYASDHLPVYSDMRLE